MIKNGYTEQTVEFEEVKRMIKQLKEENLELIRENSALKAQLSFLQQLVDQPGGRG
jgi:regulator of replication initiation timing